MCLNYLLFPFSCMLENSAFVLPGEPIGYLLTSNRPHVIAYIGSSYWLKLLFPRAQGMKGFCHLYSGYIYGNKTLCV